MAHEKKMTTTIAGVPPSADIRAQLAREGRPVLVAFSGGKDSICAALALRDAGVDVRLAYLYGVPDLGFVQRGLASMSEQLGLPIAQYPHPSLFRKLGYAVFQTPARARVIGAAKLVKIDYPLVWALIREDLGLPEDSWVADGVRANDSQQRRMAFSRYGAMKPDSRKVSAVWDWSIHKIRATLEEHGIELQVDYDWFGRSFDGIDRRFLEPIRKNAPEDYAQIIRWFPLAGMELHRHDL